MIHAPSILAALLAFSGSQDSGQRITERLESGIAAATAKLQAGRKEDASCILEQCKGLAASLEDAALRKRFMSRIVGLARQSDPLADKRSKLARKIAKDLLEVAEVYAKRAWHKTALELLEKAVLLDPELASGRIDRMRQKAAGSSSTPARSVEATDWIKDGDQPFSYTSGEWKVEGDEIKSPAPKNAISMLVAAKSLSGSYRLAIDYRIDERHGDAGLVFAFRDPDNFDVLHVMQDPRRVELRLYEFEARKRKSLLRHRLEPKPDTEWIPLSVEIKDKEILVRIGKADPIKVARRQPDYSGYPGLLIFGNTPGRKPTSFRGLRIETR
ncbi:MAG: hypothetical protein ACE5F1_02825 [Planctomycetota bacterium]